MYTPLEYKKAKNILLKDVLFARAYKQIGDITFSELPKREPYEALVRAIAHQQLNGKAAETILGRFIVSITSKRAKKSKKFPSPEEILSLNETEFRSAGFSHGKVLAIRDIAEKTKQGLVPSRKKLEKLSDEEIIATLVPLRGVGKWTVEMFLIFTLGRKDVLPVDDFGVREGLRVLTKKEKQIAPKEFAGLGERWKGQRTLMTLYLWRVADKAKLTKKKK